MNSKHQILLVVNPKAGSIDKQELIDSVTEFAESRHWPCKVFETTGEVDDQKIEALLKELNPDRLLIAGGDGTINMVAHVLQDYDIPIGILPAGSANGLASNFELPDDLESQIEVALGDHLTPMDHLMVNDHTCLHIADLGLNAELIANFEDATIRGKFGYLLQTIPTLMKTDSPFEFTIELNNQKYKHTGILLAIANANQYGTGANINPNGIIDDGSFEVLIFKTFDTIEIIRTIYDKVNLDSDFAESYSTQKVLITASVPVPFQIDGEPMGKTGRVEAHILDKKLQIAVP